MKRLVVLVLISFGTIAVAAATQVAPTPERKQLMIATPEGPNIALTATAISRTAPALNMLHLEGTVEIRTKDMILRTEEADYNEETGELEARGTVRIKLESQR